LWHHHEPQLKDLLQGQPEFDRVLVLVARINKGGAPAPPSLPGTFLAAFNP
jgi:hypothetical protein